MAFSTRVPIRFGDLDPAGVVYYPRLLHLLHCAFEEFLTSAGLPLSASLKARVGWPAVHIECEFKSPVRLDSDLEISLDVAHLGRSSVTFRYRGETFPHPPTSEPGRLAGIGHRSPQTSLALGNPDAPSNLENTADRCGLALTARKTLACVNMESFSAQPIPPEYRAVFEAHRAES